MKEFMPEPHQRDQHVELMPPLLLLPVPTLEVGHPASKKLCGLDPICQPKEFDTSAL